MSKLQTRALARVRVTLLKRILQSELHFPRWLRGQELSEQVVADVGECRYRARCRIGGTGKTGHKAIGDVESIGPKLYALPFPNLELPGQGHIQTPVSGAGDAVPPQIPNGTQRLRRKSRGVEILASGAGLTGVHLIRKYQVRPLVIDASQFSVRTILNRERRSRRES